MRHAAITHPTHWWEEEIRHHYQEFDEEVPVESKWAGGGALLLLALASAGTILFGALTIDPANAYGDLALPPGMPAAWTLVVAAMGAFWMAGMSAWLVLREDDDLGILIASAVPAFRLMPLLGALWFATLFGLRSPLLAGVVGLFLLMATMVAMMRVGRLSRTATWLLLPVLGVAAAAITLSAGLLALNIDQPVLVLPF
jgi:tryptophan-rich sensory protein